MNMMIFKKILIINKYKIFIIYIKMDLDLKNVYNKIADEFDQTRQKVWNCVKLFLDNLKVNTSCLEIGCGNGKNMLYRDDINFTGIDFSDSFIKICKKKELDVIHGDMIDLPFSDNTYDNSISVAVLHHLYKKEDRIKALKEQIRVTKKNGLIFILVWCFKQEKNKRAFKTNDEMVPWKSKNGKIYYRYYHLYNDDELEKEINDNLTNVKIEKTFVENGNSGIILRKLKNDL